MSTRELYTRPLEDDRWSVDLAGSARFSWEYGDGRDRMLALYQKGKDKQWDSVKRIDWDLEVDPYDVLGLPDESLAIFGTPYLGMQVLIEGLALAAFGLLRDITTKPLPKQILTYVMQDEARHVAFGRLALRDYYRQLSEAELREREEFVIEGCYLMRDRIRGIEMWENVGIAAAEIAPIVENSPYMQMFRKLLFSRIVPCVKDIGLWGPRLRRAYADMGVIEMAGQSLETLMGADEDLADKLDAERFTAEEGARKAEVHAAIADGATG